MTKSQYEIFEFLQADDIRYFTHNYEGNSFGFLDKRDNRYEWQNDL